MYGFIAHKSRMFIGIVFMWKSI